MRKQDAVPPIFLDGPTIEPAEGLRRWIAERLELAPRALFRLPFTFGDDAQQAALGLPGEAGAERALRLDDSALGVSLADRLRQARGDRAGPCSLWLTVRMAADGGPVAVIAVHERVADGASRRELRARAERRPDDLAVRLLGRIHCARGTARCARCREAAAEPATPALLDVRPDGPAARPTIAVEREGKKTYAAYDVLQRFPSVDDAEAFAAGHGITDVELDAAEG